MKFSTSACLLFTLILLQVSVNVTGQLPGVSDIIGGGGGTESSAGGGDAGASQTQGEQQPTTSDQVTQPTESAVQPPESSAGGSEQTPNNNSDQAQPTQSQGNSNHDNPQATPTSSTGETPNSNNGNGNNNNNGSGSNNNNNNGSGSNNNNNENGDSTSSGGSQTSGNGNNTNAEGGSDNTATIAGSVVGGVVGIALIGGLIMWMSRRGGCTKRTGRGRDGFQQHQPDDFMDMSDASYAAAPTTATTSQINQQQARPFIPPTSNGGYTDLHSGVGYNDTTYTYSDHPVPQQQEYYPYVQPQDPGYMAAAAATAPPMAAAAMAPDTAIPIGASKPDEVEVQHKPNVV